MSDPVRKPMCAMRTAGFTSTVVLGAVLLACNGNTSASRSSDERAPAVVASPISIMVQPSVAWPAASTVDEQTVFELSRDGSKKDREIRALIARSPVPVLAPKGLRLTTPTLVVEGEYFALTSRADGATISLQGTRAAHRYEGVDPTPGNRGLRASGSLRGFVSVNEGIRTASWIENGVAYSLDVECNDSRDARCQSDAFLLEVVAQLAYVGGSGR
jgi:hypothetical protein